MSGFKKKFAGFIRQLSNPGIILDDGEEEEPRSPTTGSFIQRYLNGEAKRSQPDILFSRSFQELPLRKIALLKPDIYAAFTGPNGGLTSVNRNPPNGDSPSNGMECINEELLGRRKASLAQQEDLEEFLDTTATTPNQNEVNPPQFARPNGKGRKTSIEDDYNLVKEKNYQYLYEQNGSHSPGNGPLNDDNNVVIAGVRNWSRPHETAFGAATTLYERHPVTQEKAGEPIADAFAVCARENNALLVLADGVSWGERSCLAARCAVHGCVDYLNKALFDDNTIYTIENTADIYSALLRSMFAAHNLILQEEGLLTTLCVVFICPLRDSEKFAVCACNVGDSLSYVYSQKYGVREITEGSHDIYSMRDMRDALGALGPVDGPNPELNNLTCSMTVVEPGDIVFITSDGISDNFDPVVGKFVLPKQSPRPEDGCQVGAQRRKRSAVGMSDDQVLNDICPLPIVEAYQCHELTLLRMEDLLLNGVTEGDKPCTSARQLCEKMIDFSVKLTIAKRRILEDPELYSEDNGFTQAEQRKRRHRLCTKLAMVPGKLDHASVVAYEVGIRTLPHNDDPEPNTEPPFDETVVSQSQLVPSVFHVERQVMKESFV